MNKTELIAAVSKGTGETKKAVGNVVDELISQVQKNVKKGERVSLPGFGTFERRQRGARTARNPRTGESIKVKASKVPAFKAGAKFKNAVSGKRS